MCISTVHFPSSVHGIFLEEEIDDFREMLPHPDKRRAVLSAVGSMLKWVFGTATLVDVEELHYEIPEDDTVVSKHVAAE